MVLFKQKNEFLNLPIVRINNNFHVLQNVVCSNVLHITLLSSIRGDHKSLKYIKGCLC